MKRLLLTAALLMALLPGRAEEQILYWLVDSVHNSKFEFKSALLYAQLGEGEKKGLLEVDAHTPLTTELIEIDLLEALHTDDLTGYRFFIELVNFDAETYDVKGVAITQTSSYSDLVNNHHILGAGNTIPENLIYWTPYFMIPEPSSGLLLLIGSALLALRRRRHA